jgi:hypothetical protein
MPRERTVGNHSLKGVAFCFLMSLLIFLFLLFVGYGIWGVHFHGTLVPKDAKGGVLLLRFLLFGDA